MAEMAARARQSFNNLFWNEPAGCYFDVVDGDHRDASLRPNQVIALSLGYTMAEPAEAIRALETVERNLLTPYGLRTLAPSDPRYRPQYTGDVLRRDSSYHQGTVWPWLLGPFVDASVRFRGESARARIPQWLAAFPQHLHEAGLGTISEIFDGDPPHQPRGCIAQAWSVAEILRILT
jgi:glycogen debranching enzyme